MKPSIKPFHSKNKYAFAQTMALSRKTLPGGFGGLTISLEGGLEEVEESLRAAANCCCKWAFFSCSRTLFLQLRVVIHHSKQLSLQLGYTLAQPLTLGIVVCFTQFHGVGRYRFTSHNAREIPSFLALECPALVRPRGLPPGENLARVFWLL